MKDFFISYNKADKQWAEWVAGILEDNGYTTIIQAWDFKPSDNFVLKMQKALIDAERLIAVITKDYLDSGYCQAEWSAVYSKDPNSEKSLFIPVRVTDVELDGLLSTIIYIDLVNKNEKDAIKELLYGVDTKDKPRNRPGFPGAKKNISGGMPFNNLPHRNWHFTGRKDLLNQINDNLKTLRGCSITQTLAGLGGVGKTQIALEYAFNFSSEYDAIWWVDAETQQGIISAYADFARSKGIIEMGTSDPKMIIESVKNWMMEPENKRWLFIYDNAENDIALLDYLPTQNTENRHIIITSRYAYWHHIAAPVEIDVFSEDDAIEFFEKYTGLRKNDAMLILVSELGYLPLALEQAAAYIAISKITFDKYLRLYKKYKLELLGDATILNHIQTVTVTWNISIQKIAYEDTRQILTMFAFYAPDDIRLDWFQKAADKLPSPLSETSKNELSFNRMKIELGKYSLVKIQNNGQTVRIHRLLQEVIKKRLQNSEPWIAYCLLILDNIKFSEFSSAVSRKQFLSIAPHIISVISNLNYNASESFYNYNLDFLRQVDKSLYFLGVGFDELSMYNDSLKYYKQALTLRKHLYGENHSEVATIYHDLGGIFDNMGDFDESWKWYNDALIVRENLPEINQKDIATTYNNIGLLCSRNGKFPLALDWYYKARKIRESVLGKNHPDTATTYHNIAFVNYYWEKNYTKALRLYKKALSIRKKELGNKNPDTATTYSGIALVYSKQGNYKEALELFIKAKNIREEVLGEHPATAITYTGMAEVYANLGDKKEAFSFLNKALQIRKVTLGVKHTDTAEVYRKIGLLYFNQNIFPMAIENLSKAYTIFFSSFGSDHATTVETKYELQKAYECIEHTIAFPEWLKDLKYND